MRGWRLVDVDPLLITGAAWESVNGSESMSRSDSSGGSRGSDGNEVSVSSGGVGSGGVGSGSGGVGSGGLLASPLEGELVRHPPVPLLEEGDSLGPVEVDLQRGESRGV